MTINKVLAVICLGLALWLGHEIQGQWQQQQALNSLHCPNGNHAIWYAARHMAICGESANFTVGGRP
jgi:hypothetical protein